MTSFELNGKKVSVTGKHAHLLGALRDELGVLSPKDGCSPSGQCGCCTVIMDGKARISCQLSPERADGSVIQTLEGLDAAEVARMGKVFAACGALQCGFCTPGIMIRTKVLVDKKGPELEREYAARHLGAHLCRCTGYIKILDAVESLAKSEIPEIDQNEGIGSSLIKYEAHDLAEGKRPFIDDLEVEGLLHGAFKLTDYARADIISIDTSKAEEFEGVERVITATDVPGELKVGLIHKDWPVFIPIGGRTSYLGDVIAMVVADTRENARAAAELIEIVYNELPVITNPIKAMDSKENAVWGLEGNILSTSTYKRGEPEDTWEECSHIITETFQTQRVDHAFLEPESTLATFDENGKLYVYSGGQGIWDDRNDIARVLGIEQSDLTVELVSNGGAFGGKEDMSNQAQTALAAWLIEKPVKATLSREESFLIHTKRHPIRLQYKVGCNDKGELKALTVKMVGDSGPYASVGMKVLERAAGHACGPYVIPNIEVEAVAVRTNNSVCGAFRGFGANQAQFAMEGVMDRLAEKVGISGWEIR
ncbi:MAG: molybdopterin cofactor-binding domain-containing protein, partial [Actinomycetota bacterium]|nr:molybdopterin cofactor-binding domain-containing protein [Actinomycetota bacterium]